MGSSGSDVRVVAARPDDWERVRAIRLQALADAPDAFWTTHAQDAAKPPQAWQERLVEGGPSTTYLAFVRSSDEVPAGASPVGLVVAAAHHELDDAAGLYAMYVAPSARGLGVGEALIDAVLAWAAQRGLERVVFDVGDHNQPAQRLYARMGARPTGRRDAFPAPRDHITEHELEILLGGDRPTEG